MDFPTPFRATRRAHSCIVLSYLTGGEKQLLQRVTFRESLTAANSRSIAADQLENNHHCDNIRESRAEQPLNLQLAAAAVLSMAFQNSAAAREKTTMVTVTVILWSCWEMPTLRKPAHEIWLQCKGLRGIG